MAGWKGKGRERRIKRQEKEWKGNRGGRHSLLLRKFLRAPIVKGRSFFPRRVGLPAAGGGRLGKDLDGQQNQLPHSVP